MNDIRLNTKELKILQILAQHYDTSDWGETGYYSFAPLEKQTGFTRKEVRLACRSLKRKGLTKFSVGLINGDGEMAGAGYSCSKEGYVLLNPCDKVGCKEVISFDWQDDFDNHHMYCEEHHEEYKKSLLTPYRELTK